MQSADKKGGAPRLKARQPQLQHCWRDAGNVLVRRQVPNLAQLKSWAREAERSLAFFWQTGQRRHLDAFYLHVVAMREWAAPGIPEGSHLC